MGTSGEFVEAREVVRDEPNNINKLNATAAALQLPDRLKENAKPKQIAELAAKIKAAVDGITK